MVIVEEVEEGQTIETWEEPGKRKTQVVTELVRRLLDTCDDHIVIKRDGKATYILLRLSGEVYTGLEDEILVFRVKEKKEK